MEKKGFDNFPKNYQKSNGLLCRNMDLILTRRMTKSYEWMCCCTTEKVYFREEEKDKIEAFEM